MPGSKFGGSMGDDAVSAMKNWASRLENEEASTRNWYKDWGFLITGNPGDREGEKVNGRIDTIQKQIDELEARAKAENWKETTSGAYDGGVSPESHVKGVWATRRRSPNDPSVKPTDPYA